MSNLSELLPTGGGQNAVDFVASGTLSSGQTVALKADGTVEAVAESVISESASSATTIISPVYNPTRLIYDSVHNCFFYIFKNYTNSYYLSAKIGTLSGTTVTWGTTTVIASYAPNDDATSACVDTNAEMVVVQYKESNNYSYARILYNINSTARTFSVTSNTQISPAAISNYTFAVYHEAEQKVILGYTRGNSGYAKAALIDTSGTPSFAAIGSESAWSGGEDVFWINATYHAAQEAVVISCQRSGGPLNVVAGTLSGYTLTFGTMVQLSSNGTHANRPVYDSINEKVVVSYIDESNSDYGKSVVVTVSGTTVSFGTPVIFRSQSYSTNTDSLTSSFSVISGTVVVFAWPANNGAVQAFNGTVSGTTISFSSNFNMVNGQDYHLQSAYSTQDGKVLFTDTNFTGSYNSIYQVYQASYSSTNVADFIGITSEEISDTATGAVNVYGGINEAQTGLTIGADYYVQNDGSISTTASAVKIGQAISATTINMMDLT